MSCCRVLATLGILLLLLHLCQARRQPLALGGIIGNVVNSVRNVFNGGDNADEQNADTNAGYGGWFAESLLPAAWLGDHVTPMLHEPCRPHCAEDGSGTVASCG
jgi:hypothetical protein